MANNVSHDKKMELVMQAMMVSSAGTVYSLQWSVPCSHASRIYRKSLGLSALKPSISMIDLEMGRFEEAHSHLPALGLM